MVDPAVAERIDIIGEFTPLSRPAKAGTPTRENLITRLQEFIDGEREFDDAICIEEYIVEVEVDSPHTTEVDTSRITA